VLALLVGGAREAGATPVKTLVQDTLYRADGSVAQGKITIQWNAFTTSAGEAVAAGELTVSTDANGGIAIPLIPNQGATPEGSYYKVVMRLSDGTTSNEVWSVPSGTTTTVAAIRAEVVPQSVAVQFVSEQYVNEKIAGLAAVASSGSYTDLKNTPTIPDLTSPGPIGGTTPNAVSATAISVGTTNPTKIMQGQGVNVMAYGAKCDGATDDTSAFTSALAASSVVIVPAATCVVSNVAVPSHKTLSGVGISSTTLLQKAGSTGAAVSLASSYNATVSGLTINGNASNQTSANIGLATSGINGNGIYSGSHFTINDVFVANTSGDCFNLQGQGVNEVRHIFGYECGGFGAFVGISDSHLSDLDMGSTGKEGLYLDYGSENTITNVKSWYTGSSSLGAITNVALSGGVCTYTVPNSLFVNELVAVFGLTNTACNGQALVVTSASSTQFTAAVSSSSTIASTADSGTLTSTGAGVAVVGLGNTLVGVETQNTMGDGILLIGGGSTTIENAYAESPGSNTAAVSNSTAVGLRIVSSNGNKVSLNAANNPTSGTGATMAYGVQFDNWPTKAASIDNEVTATIFYPAVGDVNINDGYATTQNKIRSICTGTYLAGHCSTTTPLEVVWDAPAFQKPITYSISGGAFLLNPPSSLQTTYYGGLRMNGPDSVQVGYSNARVIFNDGSAATNPGWVSIFYGDGTSNGRFVVQHYDGSTYLSAINCDATGNCTLGNSASTISVAGPLTVTGTAQLNGRVTLGSGTYGVSIAGTGGTTSNGSWGFQSLSNILYWYNGTYYANLKPPSSLSTTLNWTLSSHTGQIPVGPTTSVNGNFVTFSGTDGGLIQDSGSSWAVPSALGSTTPNTVNATSLQIAGATVLTSTVTGYHGTSGTKVQLSDGTGTSGNLAKFASDGSVTDGGVAASAVRTTAGGQTITAADTVSGLPSGCTQLPCLIGAVAPATYSGTSGVSTVTVVTPTVAGEYRVCASLHMTVAGTAGTFNAYHGFVSDGATLVPGASSLVSISATAPTTTFSAGCSEFYGDANGAVKFQLTGSSVTGSPTIRYGFTVERLY
jgi:hypothetical protein